MVFILQVTNCNQDYLLTYSDDVENDNGVEFAIDNSPLVADVPAQEVQETNCDQTIQLCSKKMNDNGVESDIDKSRLMQDVDDQEDVSPQGEQYQTGADYGPDYLSENEEQNNYQDHSSSSSDNQDDSPNLDCTPDEFNTTSELSFIQTVGTTLEEPGESPKKSRKRACNRQGWKAVIKKSKVNSR
ncbi:uncharacterized protein LOC120354057 [Nilaparvata lugens]|uniref:uncharacterized protein LOC120354057 n=1 Tax=Nilaparvata lugens TaxID=108931 RepID=UPI00193D9028|nr:uncharacterized protein LOC120354057 [Nilaparvata lugens]